ncbi:hypothetical protein [Candidatus Palauibacter sp.]|uniref:hypothetical protein n=1 Tax=Candidatus Palauibacter sp. TaxID=3101350 RepID=UPI003B5C1B91
MSDGATREMPGEMRARAPAAAAARRVAAGVLLLLPLPLNTGLAAQDASVERVPTLPNGVPVVVFPVQSAVPPAGGGRAGDTGIGGRAIDLLNAELAFAFGEEAGARGWALGSAVEARLARNPTIGVDPRRLAYHGLLRDPGPRRQLYEPLHTQLRQVASLFDARLVVLPLSVWYRRADRAPDAGRAVLLLAVIDVRRSAVLWHGTIEGRAADAASPAALTTLALRVAGQLAPS